MEIFGAIQRFRENSRRRICANALSQCVRWMNPWHLCKHHMCFSSNEVFNVRFNASINYAPTSVWFLLYFSNAHLRFYATQVINTLINQRVTAAGVSDYNMLFFRRKFIFCELIQTQQRLQRVPIKPVWQIETFLYLRTSLTEGVIYCSNIYWCE